MIVKKQIATAMATGAVLLNVLSPVAFAQEVVVNGNGAFAENTVKVDSQKSSVVEQNNSAYVKNDVSSNASTGGNSASYNTGGDVLVKTGDAMSDVSVANALNKNKAVVENCGVCSEGVDVVVSENGAYADTFVGVANKNNVFVTQDNHAKVSNDVDANAHTGKNDADFNTGGEVVVVTGEAVTDVVVETLANKNVAHVSGGHGHHHDGAASVLVTGNGAYSDNTVKLKDYSAVVLDQDNKAKVSNAVDADATTGKNDANYNTGGEVLVKTGVAAALVDVANKVNFNYAAVDCDCVLDEVAVKVKDNGAKSETSVKAETVSDMFVYADNHAKLFNDVEGDAQSGETHANYNGGEGSGDPAVVTGDAFSQTDVTNYGNANVSGDWEVGVEFDLSGLLAYFHLQG